LSFAMSKGDARYSFIVEWYDTAASLTRQYQLIFYTSDGTLEMYDLKNRRSFLKRCDYPGVREADLFKGSIITVYSRQLTVKDYADAFTASAFESSSKITYAVIKSEAVSSMGRIIDAINGAGFTLSDLALLSGELALAVTGGEGFEALVGQINGSLGLDAVALADASVFGGAKPSIPQIENSSLMLVRPHAVKSGALGRILDQTVGSGFLVMNAKMVHVTRPNAQEFLEVYKGVVPEYVDWVEELCSGKLVALQLVLASKPDASVLAVRELCGAHDPEIAQHLHPHSLRAQYGESKVKNATHCTDLPEDGALEVDYFFQLL